MSNVISVGAVYDAAFGTISVCVDDGSCATPGGWSICDPGEFSTEQVTGADLVAVYSNTASFLDVLAPAHKAYTTDIAGSEGYSIGDYHSSFGGTSAACPYAAGAVACLQSAAKAITGSHLSPSEIRDFLTLTGDNITDGKVAITKPRINLGKAIDLIPQVCCPITISSFPYAEGFEGGFGDWVNVEGDDIDWTRHTGSTPSSNTGPSSAYEGSHYLYIESSSPHYPDKIAVLDGPCFDLSSPNNPQLRFWYHMYGETMGTLTVEVSDDNCVNWAPVWFLSGNQGDVWYEAIVDLSAYAGSTIKMRFNGLTGSSFTSDMAIDDVRIEDVVPQPPVAEDVNVPTSLNTPVEITLKASDDGYPDPPGILTYIVTSLPSDGTLSDPSAGGISSVPYTLVNNGNQVAYTPDSGYTGLDSFQFKANDGGVPPDGGDSNTATVSLEVGYPTVEYQVGSSYDDTYAWGSTSQNLTAAYLKVGYRSDYGVPYYMSGVRFTDVNIPKGAIIISAYLKIQSYTSNLTSSVYGKIQAEATDDADDFNGRYMGSLAKTSASVDWDHSTSWSTNTWYTSPNIAGVVQEVINRSGWSANNSLAIFYSTRTVSGGYRWFSSYDRGSSYAPKLEITYTDPVTLRYTISGRVTYQGSGLADVNMVGLGVVTDANGYYSGMVSYGWSGTVTPTKEGYSFDPADRTYSNVTADQTGENYTGTPGWNISEHVFSIEIETGWDYGEPTNSDDLTYDFYLGLETDETVNLVEVNTAAGNTFTIPDDVNTQSGDIQTWHYVDHNTHYWEYEGKFADQNALADYGDGNYTITVYYEGGGQDQTTVLFGDPNTGDPITQLIQEPNLTFPEHNGTVTSPVTFTWEDCDDSNATSIWLGLEKQNANEVIDINFPADVNSSEPVTLNKGMWEAELCFDKWYDFNNADGIPVEIGKYSESDYTFKVISLPSDDFNDNGRAAMWEIYNSGEPENCWLAESNQRLEVLSTTGANSEDTGYVSYKWKVDAVSDFSFKVNFYYNPATSGEGDGRVFIHLSPSLTDVYSIHVDFSAGRDVYSPYFYCEVVDPCLGPTDIHRIDRTEDDGTLYVSYNATNDELYLSYTGYGSPNAWQAIPGLLQAQWGGAPVYVNIGGGSEGVKLDSGDAYLDNFVIESGVIKVDAALVYRFWSPTKERHFYTISERERDKLIDKYPHIWTYEGTAMCAYPEGQQPKNAEEVYRFWSPVLWTHFYTISEKERDKLINKYPHVWTYESVAWYVLCP